MEGSFVGRRQWDKEAKDLIESHTFAVLLGVGSIVALFGVGCGVVQEHWWTLDAQGAGHGSKVGKDERLTNHLVGALTLAEKKNDDIMVFFLGQSNRADQTISKPSVSSNFTSTYVGARARPYSRSLMAQPSRKDALNLARSFIVTEADEDSEAEDFESDDKHYDQSQQQEEDLRRQKAESVHLRARNYDPFAEICDRWLRQEAQPHPFKGNALSQLNDYDSDSDSDAFVPPTASPAPPCSPVVLPSPYAAPTLSSPNHDQEMEAWVLLDEYLTSDSGQGGQVHAALEKLCVGAKWDNVWGRITGMEPGDEDAATAVRNALDSIKPTVPGPTLLSDRVDSAHLEDFEVGEGEELTKEQKELAEYLNKFSDSVMLEEYGIYYVRCRGRKQDRHPKCLVQAFPSRKQGGLYVRVRSMLDANYVLAAYFHLIDGFLYSRQPVFLYAADNTRDSIARKDDPGFTVPLLWKGPYLMMPIHHRITGKTTPPPDTKPSRKRAGRESSLTDEQQAIVESFFPAWEQLLRQHKLHLGKGNNSKTRDPEAVTTWINKTLKEIRGTKGFLTGDDVRTNDEWAKIDSEGCIQKSPPQRLYQNNINDLVLNALATDEKTKTHQSLVQAAEALLSFKKPAAGKSLFEKENKEEILHGDGVSNNHNEHKENKRKENAGAEYQKVLMEMWEKTDQDDYNERAKGIDVNDNQKQFKEVIYSALCALCQNGQLGPCEMMILTGFRDKDNNLVAYKLQAHHNNDDHADAFPVDQDEEMALGNAWKDWCETRIPKPIMPAEELHTLRNANGIPVLGVVDLEQIAPAALTKVLSDFLHALWNHSWPQERVRPSIPLVEIEAHPEDFYDTSTFQFPVTLKPREAEAEAAQGTGDKIVAHPPSISPPPPKPSAPPAATSLAAILPTNASTLPLPTHGTPIGPARALTAPVASILSPSNASAPPLSTPVTPIGATGASTVPAASISPSKASTPPPSTPAINSERTSIAPLPTPPASTEEGVEAPQQSSGTPALEEQDAVLMLDDQEVSLAAPEAQVVHRSQTCSGKRTIAEITSEVEAPQRVTGTKDPSLEESGWKQERYRPMRIRSLFDCCSKFPLSAIVFDTQLPTDKLQDNLKLGVDLVDVDRLKKALGSALWLSRKEEHPFARSLTLGVSESTILLYLSILENFFTKLSRKMMNVFMTQVPWINKRRVGWPERS
ncbi:hypothetical protein BT96DRAFT_949280 [Gymnopus androsaceus JB14]|uniref:Uncharacterized protein n=1 Tax=Gymnopus androsaceus JB14 TaxID=1447944 RepID=A0A6A4GLL5_9AGAR|nr:hypothetical protein BT96DRAFT_949280 [Gymnopus androsaceus JB14]